LGCRCLYYLTSSLHSNSGLLWYNQGTLTLTGVPTSSFWLEIFKPKQISYHPIEVIGNKESDRIYRINTIKTDKNPINCVNPVEKIYFQ